MNSVVATMENQDDSLSQDLPTVENEDHHSAHDDTTVEAAPTDTNETPRTNPDDDESAQRNTRAGEWV